MFRFFDGLRNAVVVSLGIATCLVQAREPQSASAPAKIDVESVGPKVGVTLPDFSLRDQGGATHSLQSVLGPKGAIIVFFRSADW